MTAFLELFALPLGACFVMVVVLSAIGLQVLKREIIFVDIALAQVAAVGTIAAHLLLHAEHGAPVSYLTRLGFIAAASLFYAFARKKQARISLEAVIGISYAVAAAAALFLAGTVPGGHVHIKHMLSGSLLWTTGADLVISSSVFAAALLFLFLSRKKLLVLCDQYDQAAQQGVNPLLWDFLFYLVVGVVITFAVEIGGLVVVFSFLIIPAALSALFARSTPGRIGIAVGAGMTASLAGFYLSHTLDFSPGPSVVAVLGIVLALAGLYSRGNKRICGTATLAVCAVFVMLAVQNSGRDPVSTEPAPRKQPGEKRITQESKSTEKTLNTIQAPALPPFEQVGRITRLLSENKKEALQETAAFLKTDPPVFFRKQVIELLEKHFSTDIAYDVEKPCDHQQNMEVLKQIQKLGD